jgi:hypothetical protein
MSEQPEQRNEWQWINLQNGEWDTLFSSKEYESRQHLIGSELVLAIPHLRKKLEAHTFTLRPSRHHGQEEGGC